MPELTRVAVYERTLPVGEERVWENVHDWEHLPWLHAGSFRSIDLLERGDWGWRAEIGLHGEGDPKIRLELARDGGQRYVSRTLAGPGAGGEIWTTVTPVEEARTDVRVEFFVPDVPPDAIDAVGRGFVTLYTRLWDEDEAMMVHRTAMLARSVDGAGDDVCLGDETAVRDRLPLVRTFAGRAVRVVALDGHLVAHSTVCPHWLGPLDEAACEDGRVTCPWHGYRFDVTTGRRCDRESPMRLAPAPRVSIEDGRVWLRG